MERKISIRAATISDYDQWRLLWDQYNEFYGRAGKTALPDEVIQSTWLRFFDSNEPVHCLLAEHKQQIVGLAHYIFHRNTITIENTCYLQDLFSTPTLRGKGVGRKLISEFYSRAEKAGTVGVYWHTHSSNQTAMRLYDGMATNTDFVVYRKTLSEN